MQPLMSFDEDQFEDSGDYEVEFTMNRLFWQAASNSYDTLVQKLASGVISGRKMQQWLRGVA